MAMSPYEHPAYLAHVERGFCPSISPVKSWCDQRAGHNGDHRSPHLEPPPSTKVRAYTWPTSREWSR